MGWFLTHAGNGSVNESLGCGIPMWALFPRLTSPRFLWFCSQDLLAFHRRSTNRQRSLELQSQGRLRANWGSDGSRRVEAHAEEWTFGERNAWGRGQGNSRDPRRMSWQTGWRIEEKCRRNETEVCKGLGRRWRGQARAERISRAVFLIGFSQLVSINSLLLWIFDVCPWFEIYGYNVLLPFKILNKWLGLQHVIDTRILCHAAAFHSFPLLSLSIWKQWPRRKSEKAKCL